jgi:hypothetical protein
MRTRDRILLAAAFSLATLGMAGCDRGSPGERNPTAGATGHAGDTAGGTQSAQPGTGLQGGLGTNRMGAPPSPAASGAIPEGSKNRTPQGSVGNR